MSDSRQPTSPRPAAPRPLVDGPDRSPLWGYALAVAAVGLASLAIAGLEQIWRADISLSMVYLPAVLGIAAVAGRGPAVVASVLAFLAFDFLFVDPRYTFTVSDPGEWLSLLLFLLTALVTGQLAAMLRRQAQAAEQHAREMTTLYDLSQALTVAVGLEPTLTAITDRVVAVFGVRSCAVLLPGPDGALAVAASTGDLRQADVTGRDVQAIAQRVMADGQPIGLGSRAVRWQVGGQPPPGRRALYLPLRTGGQTVGVLRVGARAELDRLQRGRGADAGHLRRPGGAGDHPRAAGRGGDARRDRPPRRRAQVGAAVVGLARPADAAGVDQDGRHQPAPARRRMARGGPARVPDRHR